MVKFLGGRFLGILCRNSLFELIFSLLAVGQASVFPAFNHEASVFLQSECCAGQ